MGNYNFKNVIEIIIKNGFEVNWEIPYEIKNIPGDLVILETNPEFESVSVEYFIAKDGKKHKKITQVKKGIISHLTMERTIIPPLKIALADFAEAIV